MQDRKSIFGLSSITMVIILGAAAKFTLHIITGSNYGFFCDELKAAVINNYAMPWDHLFVYVCRKPKMSPDAIWPHLKNF
jgi:hypothetical protein